MEPVKITPHIYQVHLQLVNIFIIKIPSGLVLIDTGPAGHKDEVFDAIEKIGYKPADIKHIIVTHSHHDHSGNLADILAEVNAAAYMHAEDAKLVRKGIAYNFQSRSANRLFRIITLGSLIKFPYINIKPVKEITEVNHREHIPDANGLQVIHAPGHWPGQVALYYPHDGGVVFVADAAENKDRLRLCTTYLDRDQCTETIRRLLNFDFKIALFSHGAPIMNHASEVFRVTFNMYK